jgi:hypothetical protein
VSRSDAPQAEGRSRILFIPAELLRNTLGEPARLQGELETRCAASWAEALALCTHFRPHLIVLRSELGGVGSAAFCRAARAQAHGAKLLLITERLNAEIEADVPCDAHLISPVAKDQLRRAIADLLAHDERSEARTPLDVLVHTEGFSADAVVVDATLSNGVRVSENGMLIEASRQLALDAQGQLLFFLPDLAERLSVTARVRTAVDELRLLYWLEFLDLAPQHRALIRRYVESHEEAA